MAGCREIGDWSVIRLQLLHFIDLGHNRAATVPEGYKKIRLHLIYAVKHDGCHKARCVAGGHLTDVPNESVYSGVVSLRGIRMLLFLAELNNMVVGAPILVTLVSRARRRRKST